MGMGINYGPCNTLGGKTFNSFPIEKQKMDINKLLGELIYTLGETLVV